MSSLRKFWNHYHDIFSIQEIENSKTLQYAFYALIIGFYLGFQELFFRDVGIRPEAGAITNFTCPEYFQSCAKLYIFPSSFSSWAYSLFFTAQFTMLFAAVFYGMKKNWQLAHALIVIPFFTKLLFNLFLLTNISIPFETDHLLPCAFLLFGRNKKSNLKVAIIMLYVLSGLVKLHEAWIAGTYFSSLQLGLPLIPDFAISWATNLVILVELVGVWFLLNTQTKSKKVVLYFLVFFHIYSSIFVTFRYPLQILPILLIIFYPERDKKTLPTKFAVIVLSFVTLFNIAPFLIKGDHKITFEGKALALDMFDSNRQTHSQEKIILKNGSILTSNTSAENSVERITPYSIFFKLKQKCQDPEVERVEWNMIMSLNGSPFYSLIDEKNVCTLDYQAFQHNSWIKLDKNIVGYPEKNYYYGPHGMRAIPTISSTPKIVESSQTTFLKTHSEAIAYAYLLLAILAPIIAWKM